MQVVPPPSTTVVRIDYPQASAAVVCPAAQARQQRQGQPAARGPAAAEQGGQGPAAAMPEGGEVAVALDEAGEAALGLERRHQPPPGVDVAQDLAVLLLVEAPDPQARDLPVRNAPTFFLFREATASICCQPASLVVARSGPPRSRAVPRLRLKRDLGLPRPGRSGGTPPTSRGYACPSTPRRAGGGRRDLPLSLLRGSGHFA